jgi:molybdopterin-containing oxidoreductase family membrane subunit
MWFGQVLSVACVVLLLIPNIRRHEGILAGICVGVVAAIWIEKGLGMVVAGFEPTPFGRVVQYVPTDREILITLGVYAIGFLLLSVFYKIVVGVRERMEVA